MASRGRRGGASAREDEPRRDDQAEQQAPAPRGSVLPLPPPMDYGVFMQGLVQAMQTQAHTQEALQAQLEAQMKDYDCILGLDWLEEHYALVDCRQKKIVFRIPVLAEGHLGVNHRPLSWCQHPDMDANTNRGVQRYGRQSLWPACAAELQASETRKPTFGGLSPMALKAVRSPGVVGDVAPLEEIVETDSERGDYLVLELLCELCIS
ncbi:hypothetical protein Taro_012926 [Colocasia esculenta]|uniref:Uncharacterized protein n=1 Tax=Colocasia esculenta TaxID=4460 RepID=A0A843UE62_COLES|nr:hypothetical protein [Colocasia esculenta]